MSYRITRLGQFSFKWPWEAEPLEEVRVGPPGPLPPPVASVDPRGPRVPMQPPSPEVQRPGMCPPGYIRRSVPPFDCSPPVATEERHLPPPIPIPVDPTPLQAPSATPITAPAFTPTPTPSSTPTPALAPTPTPTSGLPSLPFGLPIESAPIVAPGMSGSGFLGQVPLVRRP